MLRQEESALLDQETSYAKRIAAMAENATRMRELVCEAKNFEPTNS